MLVTKISPRGFARGWLTALAAGIAMAQELPIHHIKLPPGFKMEVYAAGVANARQMALGPNGTLFVGSRDKGGGQVYAIPDADQDNRGDEVVVVAKGLTQPSGVAFRDGALYVAEIFRVIKFPDIENTFRDKSKLTPVVVNNSYPRDEWHGWKFIAFGPDGMLYVPVGAPCNVCEPRRPIYGTITRFNPDGGEVEIFATGVRNSVGFDWHPLTKELWFTDNGRDLMGDDRPPDELNRAPAPDLHFGFPYVHGRAISDPRFGSGRNPGNFTPPARELDPHVAAIGMRFYTGAMFPEAYRNQIFIAEHGSWNRSTPIGYRVTIVTLNGNDVVSYRPFADGWLQSRGPWGRPADVLVMPDGALLVSDDYANCIYRITYAD